jgi:hypothetical protein
MTEKLSVRAVRRLALALPILALLPGASLAQEGAPPPESERIADPAAIDKLLNDHTLYGRYVGGQPWSEYHSPDSRTAYREGDCIYAGHWWIQAGTACFRYDAFNHGRPACFQLYKHGDRLEFYTQLFGGSWTLNAYSVDRRKGNPDHMPVEGQACVGV